MLITKVNIARIERQSMESALLDTKEGKIQMIPIKDRSRLLMVKSSRKAEDKWFTQMVQFTGAIGKMTSGALLESLWKINAYSMASYKTNKNKEKELRNTRLKLELYPFILVNFQKVKDPVKVNNEHMMRQVGMIYFLEHSLKECQLKVRLSSMTAVNTMDKCLITKWKD